MQTPATWEIEESTGGLTVVVELRPPWWKVWAPRGRVGLVLDRKEAIIFYQALHKQLTRAMLVE